MSQIPRRRNGWLGNWTNESYVLLPSSSYASERIHIGSYHLGLVHPVLPRPRQHCQCQNWRNGRTAQLDFNAVLCHSAHVLRASPSSLLLYASSLTKQKPGLLRALRSPVQHDPHTLPTIPLVRSFLLFLFYTTMC